MSSLVLVYGNPSSGECIESIGYVEEVYEGNGPFIYLFQGDYETFENILKVHSGCQLYFGGAQARTVDELILMFTFGKHKITRVIDSITDDCWDFETSDRLIGIRRVLSLYSKLTGSNPMHVASGSVVEAAHEAVESVSRRARSVSQTLEERIDWYRMLIEYELSFARGYAKLSKGRLASARTLEASRKNGFHELIESYRDLRRKNVFDSDLIAGRVEILMALNTDFSLSGTGSVCKYLLVQSAYLFSLGKMYITEGEANMASLLYYRSFELLAWVIGLRSGIVKEDTADLELQLNYDRGVRDHRGRDFTNKAVQGVGQLWGIVRDYGLSGGSVLGTGLTAFGTMRNRSILGHGFTHISREAANDVERDLLSLVGSALDAGDADFWRHYKYISRSVDLDKFGVPNELEVKIYK